ncbi:potassium channel family protein [Enterococcus faecalis]|uniref:potassium channel family protein n=1 Tax=Enterococcus faecalis TaxID=1351 RepID=UPI003D771B72
MLAFFLLFRNFWNILKILFRQKEQKAVLMAVIFVLTIGTVFYHNVEKMSYLNALYFSVTTLTTVGYGDLAPKTAFGKIFSILYIFIGLGLISASIANFNQALVQHHKEKIEKKRLKDEI